MLNDLGLLFLRVSIPLMLLAGHGWGKLTHFSSMAVKFPSVFHMGHAPSLAIAVFCEIFCSALVAAGIFTRLAAIPPSAMLFIAAAFIHRADPWAKKELALLYAIPFLVLVLTGPGSFSVDWMVRKKR